MCVLVTVTSCICSYLCRKYTDASKINSSSLHFYWCIWTCFFTWKSFIFYYFIYLF